MLNVTHKPRTQALSRWLAGYEACDMHIRHRHDLGVYPVR